MRPLRRQPAFQLDAEAPVDWRARRLRGAGFGRQLAARLAQDPAYDLHAMLELVDRGCPPELAARIVAPIDDESAAC
jgi:hypothetical protein